jgi:hypothetical protein
MVMVRLFTKRREVDQDGLGDYKFDVLPRAGEVIELGPRERYEVESVEHVFLGSHAEPPLIGLNVRRIP